MKKYTILFLLAVLPFFSAAQKDGKQKKSGDLDMKELEMLDDAEFLFSNKNYLQALPMYEQLAEAHPDYIYYKYQAGICYLYKNDESEKAIQYLEEVKLASPEIEDIDIYLGRAYHLNYRFATAIEHFNKYIASGNASSKDKQLAARYIEFCKNAQVNVDSKVKAKITNLGYTINSAASEYVPVISSDEAVLIFTYRGERSTGGLQNEKFEEDPKGEYYEDIFISYRVGEQWLTPEGIGDNINSKGHDGAIALSADGQKLFMFKSSSGQRGGDIFFSELKGDTWSDPVKLGSTINTSSWEGSVSLSPDEQTLFISSERKGGLGGKDIWVSRKQPDGEWGEAQNLGAPINTKLDEDAPFIHSDGITLFFSSEGHNSMGGYDIFYSVFKNGKWTEPVNMGYPVNTPHDDIYYVLSANGETGYYSTIRKEGYGQQDLYAVSPGFYADKPVLALVVGVVKTDDKPAGATINISNEETQEKVATYKSNSSTGKYLVALAPGNKYKMAIEVGGYKPNIQYVNIKGIDTYVQVQNNVNLPRNDEPLAFSDPNELQKKIEEQIKILKDEVASGEYERKVYQKILKNQGDTKTDGVNYFVELGTYENASDFYPARVVDVLAREENPDLGKIRSRANANGNTTYYLGPFKTLLDGEIFRYKVFRKDSSLLNTVVTVEDHGQRKLIQQYYASEYTRSDYVPPTDTKVIPAYSKGIMPLQTSGSGVDYNKLVNDYGKQQIKGLSFKVEVGAHVDTSNFTFRHLEKYGKIEKRLYPDSITRYSIGPFRSLAEADSLRDLLVKNHPDAAASFVTVFVFGERKTIPDHYVPEQPIASAAPKKEEVRQEEIKTAEVKEEIRKEEPPVKEEPAIASAAPCSPPEVPMDFTYFAGKDLNDKAVYNRLIDIAGNICVDGLIFKVQIGAYRNPKNFTYPNLRPLEPPPAEVVDYPDGITRFTMREFKTLKEAEKFRQTVIAKGTRDAWITPFYQGNRMLMQELIAVNFYGKSVN